MDTLTTPHGLGYAKFVIVVDADVDPFNLNQVMWAMSVRANPAGDVVIIPLILPRIPPIWLGAQRDGPQNDHRRDHTRRATRRGDYGQFDMPEQTDVWRAKLLPLINTLKK